MEDDDSPTRALLREYVSDPTLDDWLNFNGVSECLDDELLDVIPSEFADEYAARVRVSRTRAETTTGDSQQVTEC